MRLAILFVEYDNGKYPGAFGHLQAMVDKIENCRKTYFIIDNLHENRDVRRITENVFRLGGDNTDWEFSGWQRGVDVINQDHPDYDVVLFANDAFMAYGWSLLETHATIDLLKRAVRHQAAIGQVDTKGFPMDALGYDVSSWICTNCFVMPAAMVRSLGSVVSVDDAKLDQVVNPAYWAKLLLEKKLTVADLRDGFFSIACDFNGSPSFRLAADQSFTPEGDPRELCLMIKNIVAGGKSFDRQAVVSGFYAWEGAARWMNKNARVDFHEMLAGPLRIEGYLPAATLKNRYNGALTLGIYQTESFFRQDAPVGTSYRQMVIQWLTEEWHSKHEIDESNWLTYRKKVKAMLNESLLTARIKEKKFKVESYKQKPGWASLLKDKLADVVHPL